MTFMTRETSGRSRIEKVLDCVFGRTVLHSSDWMDGHRLGIAPAYILRWGAVGFLSTRLFFSAAMTYYTLTRVRRSGVV